MFPERPGQAMCRFATARGVTRRANRLWFRHSRRPSESCRGFVRSVEQVKPERPSLSAMQRTSVETDLQYPRTATLYESGAQFWQCPLQPGQTHDTVGHHNSIAGRKPGLGGKPRGPRGPPADCQCAVLTWWRCSPKEAALPARKYYSSDAVPSLLAWQPGCGCGCHGS